MTFRRMCVASFLVAVLLATPCALVVFTVLWTHAKEWDTEGHMVRETWAVVAGAVAPIAFGMLQNRWLHRGLLVLVNRLKKELENGADR